MKNAALALAISKFLKYFRNHLERLWVHKSLKTRAGIVPRITFTLFSSFSQFYVLEFKKKISFFVTLFGCVCTSGPLLLFYDVSQIL